jgi:predicted dehydrogenase
VDIATPASTHASLVRRSIPYAHVFAEKPLALTVAECASLYRLAQRHGRLLAVGHIFRFNRAVSQVKRMLARRARPHMIRIALTGSARGPGDVGALLTFLHAFDILEELVGTPHATIPVMRVPGGRQYERYAALALVYQGLAAFVEVGWIGGARRRLLELSFDDLLVRTDLVSQTVELAGPARRSRMGCYQGEPLRIEFEHFLDVIRGRRTLRPSPAQVLNVMRMVRGAQDALAGGRTVRWRG